MWGSSRASSPLPGGCWLFVCAIPNPKPPLPCVSLSAFLMTDCASTPLSRQEFTFVGPVSQEPGPVFPPYFFVCYAQTRHVSPLVVAFGSRILRAGGEFARSAMLMPFVRMNGTEGAYYIFALCFGSWKEDLLAIS